MTGIERNADVVSMASYAPLFAHVTGWQWTPNLIWFDNACSYNTPNYYVQQLFSVNKGTDVVPLLAAGKVVCGQDSCWASAVVDAVSHELVIKLVNMSDSGKVKRIRLSDAAVSGNATLATLSNVNLGIMNSIAQPDQVKPAVTTMAVKEKW